MDHTLAFVHSACEAKPATTLTPQSLAWKFPM
jgi:hypothetical protein